FQRAFPGEGANVDFVKDIVFQGNPLPGLIGPAESRMIDYLGRAMDPLGLEMRGRSGPGGGISDTVLVEVSGLGFDRFQSPLPAVAPPQCAYIAGAAGKLQVDIPRFRREHSENAFAMTLINRP